ncbi:MAG TPA: hypothetical protein VLA51_12365, partial [Paracoccaceae bacterium]|nr:hypothetical protein [Paracoccaceae bacterium]
MPIRSITPVGSCRIVQPVRRNAASLDAAVRDGRSYGYTHTSAEALQQLRFMLGDVHFANELLPVIAPKGLPEAASGAPSDITVVELSSGKDLRIDGAPVQLNYFSTHFREFIADHSRAFWVAAKG